MKQLLFRKTFIAFGLCWVMSLTMGLIIRGSSLYAIASTMLYIEWFLVILLLVYLWSKIKLSPRLGYLISAILGYLVLLLQLSQINDVSFIGLISEFYTSIDYWIIDFPYVFANLFVLVTPFNIKSDKSNL